MTGFTAQNVADWVDRFGDDNCSDLHLTPHRGLLTVKYKETKAVPDVPTLDAASIDDFATSLFEHHREGGWNAGTWQAFASTDQARRYRARVTLRRTVHGTTATLRIIPRQIPTWQQLGLTKKVVQLVGRGSGFIGIAGPTGSGKSSTLAACIAALMDSIDSHVYMLEDPTEFIHQPRRSLVTQRELGTHFRSYEDGIKDAKGSHPRVIVVGEIRDGEVAQAALDAALSGHLVISTLHASSVEDAIAAMIAFYPADKQHLARAQLAQALQAVVVQSLVRKDGTNVSADEPQMALVQEVAINDRELEGTIRADVGGGSLHHVRSYLRGAGRRAGNVPFEDSLAHLVRNNKVKHETAAAMLREPQTLTEALNMPARSDLEA